jgi:hypothetical protein
VGREIRSGRRLGIRPRRRRRSLGLETILVESVPGAFSSNVLKNLSELWDPLEAVVFGLGLDPGCLLRWIMRAGPMRLQW